MEKLNVESLKKIDEIVAKHTGKLGPVKLMLHDVQNALGYIPFEAMEKIAKASNTSVAEVYGVVTFYTQFTTEPKGKCVINICLGGIYFVTNLLLTNMFAVVMGSSPDEPVIPSSETTRSITL